MQVYGQLHMYSTWVKRLICTIEPLVPPTKSQCSPRSIVTAVSPKLNKKEHSNCPDASSYSCKEMHKINKPLHHTIGGGGWIVAQWYLENYIGGCLKVSSLKIKYVNNEIFAMYGMLYAHRVVYATMVQSTLHTYQ